VKFYFIHEDGTALGLSKTTNQKYYERLVELTETEPHHSGLIGVIDDTGRVRATLGVNQYRGKFRNAIFDFVRKYRGLEKLEQIAKDIRKQE
jgi:hypothetical protein